MKFICALPFQQMIVSHYDINLCCFRSTGYEIDKEFNIDDFFKSDGYIKQREEILRGDYSKCPSFCHMLVKGKESSGDNLLIDYEEPREIDPNNLPDYFFSDKPNKIVMAIEDGCNLACPTCRSGFKGNSLSTDEIDHGWENMSGYLKNSKEIVLGGDGEPLIQKNVRKFLQDFNVATYPRVETIILHTNGIYLDNKFISSLSKEVRERLILIMSVDAYSEEVYKKIRPGGSFKKLQENIEIISQSGFNYFEMTFVVQKINFHEIIPFISWAKKSKAKASLTKVNDWEVQSREDFLDTDVVNHEHEKHGELIKVLASEEFKKAKEKNVEVRFQYKEF